MPSHRPVYIPRKRKATQANNDVDTTISKSSGGNHQTRKQSQKQHQPRFHGAFTGGFSAGYFNTVGTKEGWIPSQIKKKDQRLEDFMDDEDHANWGGPTRLRDEYGTKNVTTTESVMKDHSDPNNALSLSQNSRVPFLPLASMLEVSHQTVGPRLLRRLGWRAGGSVIIPENATSNSAATGTVTGLSGKGVEIDDNTLENLVQVHLSRRKLRKIQLQSSRIKLPPPKLDQCGLGFEPYKNAPEFQRYREKRKQQARDRASYNTRGNVYRISDVSDAFGDSENIHGAGRVASSRHPHDNNGCEYLSYETVEDFVGKRSAAGFALRDDEDDAYDDEGTHNNLDKHGNNKSGPQSFRVNGFKVGDEYNTEVYDHESSGDDEHDGSGIRTNSRGPISKVAEDKQTQAFAPNYNNSSKKAVDVGNMFAAWAGTDQSSRGAKASSTPQSASLTSDGRPPLAGFVIGDGMNKSKRRYSGPDIPRDYTIQRHEFGEHENPYVLEVISNAVRLEQKEERKSQMRQQTGIQRRIQLNRDGSSRPLSKHFSSLGEAMKSRFTSSTGELSTKGGSTTDVSKTLPAGLHMPTPVEKKEVSSMGINDQKSMNPMSKVKIMRTVESFFPNPLLCKRFRVPVPTNVRKSTGLIATVEIKNNESAYFEREILGKATQQYENKKQPLIIIDDTTKVMSENEANVEEKSKGIDRPSIENLRSIFQASSDESSSSEDDDIDEDGDKTNNDVNQSLKRSFSHSREDQRPQVLHRNDIPIKEGSPGESREIVGTRPSLSQEDEVDNFSSRSSDSDDESSRAMAVSSHKRRKEKHRRKHHRRKRHKRKYSRSTEIDYNSDRTSSHEEEEERRRDRRRREQKKRKKKKSSSSLRHRSRKREKEER